MRIVKFISVGVALLAGLGMSGLVSVAAGEGTALCKTHEDPCESTNLVKELHAVAGTTILKTSILTVLCLSSLANVKVEAPYLAEGTNPLGATFSELTWANCGSNKAHNNCSVTNLKLPLLDVTRTVLNLGTVNALNAEILILCGESIHCIYGGAEAKGFTITGALHTAEAGHGMLSASELSVPKVGGFLCPSESKWTALYEPLEHVYVVS